MFTTRHVYGAVIGVSAPLAALVVLLAIFEQSQPGYSANKYYRELHPSPDDLVRLEMRTAAAPLVSRGSELAKAPTIVIPTGLIVAIPPR